MLDVDRQGEQIDLLAGLHHLLDRRLVALEGDELRRPLQPRQQFGQQAIGRHAEGLGEARTTAGDVADQRRPLGPHGAEQHRLRIALEMGGDVAEFDRLLDNLELIGSQRLDEAQQAECIEIHLDGGHGRIIVTSSNAPQGTLTIIAPSRLIRPRRAFGQETACE